MAGPLAIAGAGRDLAKAVTNDLVVIEGQWMRRVVVQKARRRSKRFPQGQKEIVQLVPIEIEAHINPVAIGIGALAVGAAAIAATIAWNGIRVGVLGIGEVEVVKGLKDIPRIKELAADRESKRQCEAAGGIWDPRSRICTIPSSQSCEDLCRLYREARTDRRYTDSVRYAQQMQARGCPPCSYP